MSSDVDSGTGWRADAMRFGRHLHDHFWLKKVCFVLLLRTVGLLFLSALMMSALMFNASCMVLSFVPPGALAAVRLSRP